MKPTSHTKRAWHAIKRSFSNIPNWPLVHYWSNEALEQLELARADAWRTITRFDRG